MTTAHDNEAHTTAVSVTSSPSASLYGVDFYFKCAVVVVGLVGAVGNTLVLYAMVASGQHKKQLLIFNQNVFDFCSCLLLAVIYALFLCDFHLTGTLGYWLCMLVFSESLIGGPFSGSIINLASITVDRYLKIVHPTWTKKWVRKWVIYSAIAFAWISGIANNMAVGFLTSAVIDGVCYGYAFWDSRVAQVIYAVWHVFSFYVVIIAIFIFCYWRILIVIRRQASVMAGHSGHSSSTAQSQSNQMQSNVIKTMILVSALYVTCLFPLGIVYLINNLVPSVTLNRSVYYATIFFSFLYFSSNPFIYAIKFDPVKRVLLRLNLCKKNVVQPRSDVGMNVSYALHEHN